MRLSDARLMEIVLLKDEVWAELRKGKKITEAYINGDKSTEWVYGITEIDGKRVVVNPVHSVMETLVHELLHRLHPRWGERRVVKAAHHILITMNDADICRWHRQYQRVRRVQKRPIEVEE